MPDTWHISDAVASSMTIGSVVAQLTFDEFLLAIICVLPLLFVLGPLTARLTGRDREPKTTERDVEGGASADISPRVAQLEARAEASARQLERARATDDAAFEALHQDIAGIAWELMKLRSELGAEDTRATQLVKDAVAASCGLSPRSPPTIPPARPPSPPPCPALPPPAPSPPAPARLP